MAITMYTSVTFIAEFTQMLAQK